jgi:phage protein D
MLVPIFELFYEKKNITKDVSPYVTNIEYTDYEHGQSDELQITFEDSGKQWQSSWLPSKGDSLRAYIGYQSEKLLNCGTFEIDELEYLMQKHGLAIRAIPLLI